MDNIISKFIGNDNSFPLRHRVLNVIIIIGIIMSFSACIMNYVLGLGMATVIAPFICGVITVGLYLTSIIGRKYDLPVLLSVIMLSFIFFPTMWFINAGSYGSIPYYMIINAGIIAVLLSGLKRKIIFTLYALVVGALIVIEYRMPNLIVEYKSDLIRYQDSSFGLFICLISIAVIIAVLIDGYINERQKSEQYLSMLREQNKQIEAKNRALEKSNTKLKEAKKKAIDLNKQLYNEKQKLHMLSITDDLTGAFNKKFIITRLDQEIEKSHKSRKKLTVAMIDIDNFKSINDTYGHLFGDYSLKRIGETIISNLRGKDIIGRFGGDEFLILLPDTNQEEGIAIVERIRKKISELVWENNLQITISGGVIEIKNQDHLPNLLNKVDKLLYKAKFENKNRIEQETGWKCY